MSIIKTKIVYDGNLTDSSGVTTPVKSGWAFSHWTDNITTLSVFDFDHTPIGSNKSLYPVYVLADPNTGNGMTSPHTFSKPSSGSKLISMAVSFAKQGDISGQGTQYGTVGYYIMRIPCLRINSTDSTTKYYIYNPSSLAYKAIDSSTEESVSNGDIMDSAEDGWRIRFVLNITSEGVATFSAEASEDGGLTWESVSGRWSELTYHYRIVDNSVTIVD